jgi:hypothetical protein
MKERWRHTADKATLLIVFRGNKMILPRLAYNTTIHCIITSLLSIEYNWVQFYSRLQTAVKMYLSNGAKAHSFHVDQLCVYSRQIIERQSSRTVWLYFYLSVADPYSPKSYYTWLFSGDDAYVTHHYFTGEPFELKLFKNLYQNAFFWSEMPSGTCVP